MERVLITLIVVALLAGCNENSDSEPVNELGDVNDPVIVENKRATQVELDENQVKWANANLTNYSYTYRVTCFCPQEEAIVVSVQDGAVASAFFTPSGVMLGADRLEYQRTVDDYFGLIQAGLDDDYARLDVFYDAQYGYPLTIDVDVSLGIADEEVIYQIGNLQ